VYCAWRECFLKKWLFFLIICLLTVYGYEKPPTNVETDIEKVDLKLRENEIGITFIDLTSGEATLIQHGNRKNVLINTGGPNTFKQLKKILDMFNVHEINTLIITKDDEQYIANTKNLIKHYRIQKFATGQHLLAKSQLNNKLKVAKWETWKTNETIELLPSLTIQVVHDDFHSNKHLGLDLLMKFHKHNILYMTSADQQLEKFLLQKPLSDVNILKVAHFGDKNGTSKPFVDHVDPQVAIIFRKKNEWPSQDVIERLYQTWIDIYPTKQFGTIAIKMDETLYEVIPLSFESSF
jgi:competence protein ComEC